MGHRGHPIDAYHHDAPPDDEKRESLHHSGLFWRPQPGVKKDEQVHRDVELGIPISLIQHHLKFQSGTPKPLEHEVQGATATHWYFRVIFRLSVELSKSFSGKSNSCETTPWTWVSRLYGQVSGRKHCVIHVEAPSAACVFTAHLPAWLITVETWRLSRGFARAHLQGGQTKSK